MYSRVLVSRQVKGDTLRREVKSSKIMEKCKARLNPKREPDHLLEYAASYGVFHHQRTTYHPIKAPYSIPVKTRRIRWRPSSFLINFFSTL